MTFWRMLALFMAALAFAVIVFSAVKSLRGAAKDELANHQLRVVRVLTAVWVLLWAAHTAALLLMHPLPQSYYPTDTGTGSLASMLFTASPQSEAASPVICWSTFNILFGVLVFVPRRLPFKNLRTLLYVASVLSAALLLTWPLAHALPAAGVRLPRDLTLVVSAFGGSGLALLVIFSWPRLWPAIPRAGKRSTGEQTHTSSSGTSNP